MTASSGPGRSTSTTSNLRPARFVPEDLGELALRVLERRVELDDLVELAVEETIEAAHFAGRSFAPALSSPTASAMRATRCSARRLVALTQGR
jgi:hypothetical protein